MDILPFLLVGGILVVLIALAVVAAVFARNAFTRLDRLEEEVRKLRDAPGPREAPMRPAPPAPEPPLPVAAPRPTPPSPPGPAPVEKPQPVRPVPVPPPFAVPRIEWERWLGVRGAAVLGGIFLAIAGILFFQYTIERGLITKEMRVALGIFAGIACLTGGEAVRRREYALTGNAITGAGAVILYAAFWSAYHLGIFGFAISFAAMALVTALCGFLSWRNRSQVVAWLGLSGGFATPLLLATDRDNPVGLFGYLLLLDVSFLFVANKRKWPSIGALGLLGTVLIQALWVAKRMGPETFVIALVVLGVFALLFVAFSPKGEGRNESVRRMTQAGGLLLPFAFAVYFAGRVDVGYHVYPMILLCVLLAIAAGWMSRKQDAAFAPVGASVGGTAMALVWVLSNHLEMDRTWELVVCASVFAGTFLAFCEWRRADAGPARPGHDMALLTAALGMIAVLFAAIFRAPGVEIGPFLVGFLALSLAILRLDALVSRIEVSFLATLPAAVGIGVWLGVHARTTERPDGLRLLLVCLAAPLLFLGAARLKRESSRRKLAYAAAALACVPFFPALARGDLEPAANIGLALASVLVLGVCMAIGASGARLSALLGLAALATAIAQASSEAFAAASDPADLRLAFLVLTASSAVFVAWPLLRRTIWSDSRGIGWFAPLAAIFGYPAAAHAWSHWFKGGSPGVPPAIYGAIFLAVSAGAFAGRRSELEVARARGGPSDRTGDRSGTTVAGIRGLVVAAFFLGLVLPTQLEREPHLLAPAATSLAAAFLWRRTDQLSLKYIAAIAAAVVGLYTLFTALDHAFVTQDVPIWNRHAFDILVPGAALIGASLCVLPEEVARVRESEKALYSTRRTPYVSALAGLCGLFVVFAWINVEVANHFATADRFRLDFGDLAARDLTLSIAWAIYAIVLLLLGMARKSGMLRWVSLILLLGTIGKLFLIDLRDLRGLYRVGSFFGLALSLLAVSWLYQRFVFRKAAEPAV